MWGEGQELSFPRVRETLKLRRRLERERDVDFSGEAQGGHVNVEVIAQRRSYTQRALRRHVVTGYRRDFELGLFVLRKNRPKEPVLPVVQS